MASEAAQAAREMIGRTTEPETRPPVTLDEILRYAYAVDDVRPSYVDQERAAEGPYRGIVAPPLFTGFTSFPPTAIAGLRPDGLPDSRSDPLQLRIPGARSRFTGTDVTFGEPIRPGDVLTRQSRIVGVEEKEGRSGAIIFTTKEMTITNQHGRTVMVDRTTTATVLLSPDSDAGGRAWGDLELEDGSQARPAPPPQWTDEPVWEDVREGEELTALPRFTSTVQVFLYGLVKTNSHLVHYDRAYAQVEGLPERIAQGDLSSDLLCQTATRWMGRRGILRSFRGENRSPAFIGETIMHYGRVARTWREVGDGAADDDGSSAAALVELELWSEGSGGRPCVRGSAIVQLPTR